MKLIAIWNVHSVCMESGTVTLDLSGVKKSAAAYFLGKSYSMPKAKSFLSRCDADEVDADDGRH